MKQRDLPFITVIEYPGNTALLRNAWEIARYPSLIGELSARGIQIGDGASDFEKFRAAFPCLFDKISFRRKLGRLGIPLADDAQTVWRDAADHLLCHPVTDSAFRYAAGNGFSVFSVSVQNVIDAIRDIRQEETLSNFLLQMKSTGVSMIDIPFGSLPFFELPESADEPDAIHEKSIVGKRLTDREEKVRQTDILLRICRVCCKIGMRVRFVSGTQTVRNTLLLHTGKEISLELPCGNYTDLARLYDYLSLRNALPVTMICPRDVRDYASAVAISSAFERVFIGLRPEDAQDALPILYPENTVFLPDPDCPAAMDVPNRSSARRCSAHERIFYRNFIAFLHS